MSELKPHLPKYMIIEDVIAKDGHVMFLEDMAKELCK